MKPIIIVGAGLAGYGVAREWRKLDHSTPLMIVTADHGDFYSKPMLSNAFAQHKTAHQLASQNAAQMAAQLNATIITQTHVTAIATEAKTITTDHGIFDYEKLVIATGARPIRLALDGDAADQVMSINHLRDYTALRERIAAIEQQKRPGPVRIAILGAGLIGCEFANDLSIAGHAVTLVDPNPLPLSALAAPALSRGLQEALLATGVAMRLGTTAMRVARKCHALQLTLTDETSCDVDVVLSAIGLRPDLALAQAANLTTGRGIHVDRTGRTSAPEVYALGDCVEYTLPADGGMRMLPYIAPLLEAARAIARTLAGQTGAIELKPAPVLVKTPCYPLALIAPPPSVSNAGTWHTVAENGQTICRFFDEHGTMTGFGIARHDAGTRQRMLAALGARSVDHTAAEIV